MTAAPKDLASSLKTLSIHPTPPKSSKPKKAPVADSWEDDASDSDTETEEPINSTETPLSPQESASYPSVPPPTPISPTTGSSAPPFASFKSSSTPTPSRNKNVEEFANPFGYPGQGSEEGSARGGRGDGKRQEKTDAVARRMIAGALGVRAPKKTAEHREYERVAKEKEIRRRKEEKEEEERKREEEEKRKKEVWEG